MQGIILKVRYFERGLSKSLKLIFSFAPSLFQWTKLSKKKKPGTSDQSFFMLQNKCRKFPLLVMYYLTKFDNVI